MSIRAQAGLPQSQRDDMESFGYCLIYLLKGQLPWWTQEIAKIPNKKQQFDIIYKLKQNTNVVKLCEGIFPEFQNYFNSLKKLKYGENPPYEVFKQLFEIVMLTEGWSSDGIFEWT